jgi:hypothetical protein
MSAATIRQWISALARHNLTHRPTNAGTSKSRYPLRSVSIFKLLSACELPHRLTECDRIWRRLDQQIEAAMITNAGLVAGSAAVLAALAMAMASPGFPKTSAGTGYCSGVADGLADECSGWGRDPPGLAGVRMIDLDIYTGRFPIRPTLDAAKARLPRGRLSDVGSFGCRTLG